MNYFFLKGAIHLSIIAVLMTLPILISQFLDNVNKEAGFYY